ncbi:MAG: hypothetical protein AB1715_08575 [Acidobacteriota bacterium]
MIPVKEYRAYRNAYIGLNHKIMDSCLKHDRLQASAKLLGIVHRDVMVFENEEETSVLMDFALHEYKEDGKNAIALYREKVGGKSAMERSILNALLSSRASLFRIELVSLTDNTTTLRDLLSEEPPARLLDIGLSCSGTPGFSIFVRLVPFKDLFMTSGISFVFPPSQEKDLLEQYEKLRRKTEPDRLSMEKFVYFFGRSRKEGLRVIYR